jgi:L-fucose isomerase-like protein
MSAIGASLSGSLLEARAEEKAKPAPSDFIDPATLRPRPEVRIAATFLEQPRPYWLGWPGTTYDLDTHQKRYASQLAQSAERLGVKAGLEPKPISTEAGVEAWITKIKAEKPQGLLVMLQHMGCWNWVTTIAKKAGLPLIVFAPVGTAFTGHVDGASRLPGVHVISSLEWPAVEDGLRIIKAKQMFEATRILWIHSDKRNETVMERLGVKVRAIPRDTFNKEFDKQSATEEVKDVASDFGKHAKKIVEPKPADVINCSRAYLTAKRLLAAEKAHALSMDCLGMVGSKLVPTPPCGAWTMLQDQGITAGCEADLFGAVSMMMTSYLLDRPGYMNDPVPETYKNLLIASHCTSGTRLAGFDKPPAPFILRNHSESALGVSTQVLWPQNEAVTLVRFTSANEMIIDTGRVVSNVDTPPAGGCRTSVEIKMDDIEDCRDVRGFHQVVTLGNHRRILEAFCEMYGIKHLHSPKTSTFAQGGPV